MITESKVTEIFVMADDFCKFFDQMMKKPLYFLLYVIFASLV